MSRRNSARIANESTRTPGPSRGPGVVTPQVRMMNDVTVHPLTVIGLRQSDDEETPPRIVLEDETGRQLEIIIGACEALSIQMALDNITMGRPFTHDLFVSLVDRLDGTVQRVVIDDLSMGTYYARLTLKSPAGAATLDCRPSDGIAIALRTKSPILASELVMTGGDPNA